MYSGGSAASEIPSEKNSYCRFLVAWKGCGGSNGGRRQWLLQVVGGLEGMSSKQGWKETVVEGSATA